MIYGSEPGYAPEPKILQLLVLVIPDVGHGDEQGALTEGRRDSGDSLSVHRIRVGGAGLHRYGVFQKLALGAPPHVSGVPHSVDRCCGGPSVGELAVSPDALGERTPGDGRWTTLC